MNKTYNLLHAVSTLDRGTKVYKTKGCNHINRLAVDLYRKGLMKPLLEQIAKLEREDQEESERAFEEVFYDRKGNVIY